MRTLESAIVGLALATVVAGVVLGGLVAPPFTETLVRQLDVATASGLAPDQVLDLAERTRRFVTRRDSPPLPSAFEGEPAFDADAVAHLVDVRDVLLAARRLTGVLAAVLAVWLAMSVSRRRFGPIAAALRAGALWCAVLPLAAAIVGLSDFDVLFTAFHGLFFEAGTWTFSSDALLIRLFPEAFWATAAAVWAAGIVFGGAVLWLGSAVVRGSAHRASEGRGALPA